MPSRLPMEHVFTLDLTNRDSPPSYRSSFREKWYPPSPEPFNKDDPLMRTVDCRFDSTSFASDLCVPAMSDIDEEEERDGVIIFTEEAIETTTAKKRPRFLLFLEDLVFTVKLKCRQMRGKRSVLSSPKPSFEVDLLS